MSASNYGRHRFTRQYVFLREGERPSRECLSADWIWYRELTEAQVGEWEARYWIEGETLARYCLRLDHGPQVCETCRQARIAAGRGRGLA